MSDFETHPVGKMSILETSLFAGNELIHKLEDTIHRLVITVILLSCMTLSLFAYIVNQGPRPTLHVEDVAYGQYSSLNGASENEFPRVVQQQANGNGEDIVPAIESEWATDPDTPTRSLRDKITDVMRDRETG